jgi:DNA-binding TFAR19-related protein (PDSD5 family)
MKMAMDQLKSVQAEVAQMREAHAAQLKAEQDKASAKEQELQAERAAAAKLQESLDAEAKKQLDAARSARNDVFKQLQNTLGNFAQPGINNAVINQAQPDAGTASNPEQVKLAAETNTMEQAIKQLMSSTEQVATMQQNNDHLKRKQSGIASALTGFNGMSMPTGIKVNASAEDDAAPFAKRQCKSDFLDWRSANPDATWRQVNSFYIKSINHAANGMSARGMVNASKGPWSAARLQEAPPQGAADFNCCHAGALHPELFDMIQEYNTGKMPSSSATMQLAEEGKRVYDVIASGRKY